VRHAGFVDVGACWVCGGSALTRIHDAIIDLDVYRDQHPDLAKYTGEAVWFRRCASCGFTQPEQLPSLAGFFDQLYDQLWSPEWVQEEFESEYKDLIFHTILDGLARRRTAGPSTPLTAGPSTPLRASRHLLDIGAHAGRFMRLARDAGWEPEGIELNPRTAAFAAKHTGLPVHSVNVDHLVLSGRSYGAVTLIDVLEHVPHPLALLSRIYEALEPGGWVVVKVPSGPAQRQKENMRARLRKGYRPRLADNLVHVNHFSPTALRTVLQRAGLGDVSIGIGPPELPPGRGALAVISNLARQTLYHAGRLVPGGVHTPLALNLLAYARRPS
jgi:SAM-dependent methyltransferase